MSQLTTKLTVVCDKCGESVEFWLTKRQLRMMLKEMQKPGLKVETADGNYTKIWK